MMKFSKIIAASLLTVAVITGCQKEDKSVEIVPDQPRSVTGFEYSIPDSVQYQTVHFTSTSKDYKELLWQFGDDSTSVEESPVHKYVYDGTYRVTLTTRNAQGLASSKQILLKVYDPAFDPTKVGESYFATIGGKLTVSRDNGGGPNGGEGSLKVVDGSVDTKFLQSGFAGDLWMKFELDSAVAAGAYTLTSANDDPSRDPVSWVFQGSEDDIKWIDLDSRSGQTWNGARKTRKIYHFNNNVVYKYYRIRIKTVGSGSRLFQLAEWTVNKKQPDK